MNASFNEGHYSPSRFATSRPPSPAEESGIYQHNLLNFIAQ